ARRPRPRAGDVPRGAPQLRPLPGHQRRAVRPLAAADPRHAPRRPAPPLPRHPGPRRPPGARDSGRLRPLLRPARPRPGGAAVVAESAGRPPRTVRPAGRRPRPAARGLPRGHHPAQPRSADLPRGGTANGPQPRLRGKTREAGRGEPAAASGRTAMNPTQDQTPADAPRLFAAVQEYLGELEAGRRPDRRAFVARFPDLAEAMAP